MQIYTFIRTYQQKVAKMLKYFFDANKKATPKGGLTL